MPKQPSSTSGEPAPADASYDAGGESPPPRHRPTTEFPDDAEGDNGARMPIDGDDGDLTMIASSGVEFADHPTAGGSRWGGVPGTRPGRRRRVFVLGGAGERPGPLRRPRGVGPRHERRRIGPGGVRSWDDGGVRVK
jgi:hypothetical protein